MNSRCDRLVAWQACINAEQALLDATHALIKAERIERDALLTYEKAWRAGLARWAKDEAKRRRHELDGEAA
jgi:hypothetical protein